MSKGKWLLVVVGAAAFLLAVGVLGGGIYRTVNLGDGEAYIVNRFTGKAVSLQSKAGESRQLSTLPAGELAKLDARASLTHYDTSDSQFLTCSMYNGSRWTVHEVTVSVSATAADGTEVRDRMYRLTGVGIEPLARGEFLEEIDLRPRPDGDFEWGLVSASGALDR